MGQPSRAPPPSHGASPDLGRATDAEASRAAAAAGPLATAAAAAAAGEVARHQSRRPRSRLATPSPAPPDCRTPAGRDTAVAGLLRRAAACCQPLPCQRRSSAPDSPDVPCAIAGRRAPSPSPSFPSCQRFPMRAL